MHINLKYIMSATKWEAMKRQQNFKLCYKFFKIIVWNFRMWLLPVSLVLDLPVNSCKKSWYSRVSETCILFDEYIFIVMKNDINSSNSPSDLLPPSARISPNLFHVQWGKTIDFADTPRKITLSATSSRISTSCSWKADLQRPLRRIELLVIFNSNVSQLGT